MIKSSMIKRLHFNNQPHWTSSVNYNYNYNYKTNKYIWMNKTTDRAQDGKYLRPVDLLLNHGRGLGVQSRPVSRAVDTDAAFPFFIRNAFPPVWCNSRRPATPLIRRRVVVPLRSASPIIYVTVAWANFFDDLRYLYATLRWKSLKINQFFLWPGLLLRLDKQTWLYWSRVDTLAWRVCAAIHQCMLYNTVFLNVYRLISTYIKKKKNWRGMDINGFHFHTYFHQFGNEIKSKCLENLFYLLNKTF